MYDFLSLSPYEFESLVNDLLQAQHGWILQSFAQGRDGGVDGEVTDGDEPAVVVQCKHYGRSGFNKLLAVVRDQELPKIAQIQPARYVLATSVDLTRAQKQKLKDVLAPWALSTEDIIGLQDLNTLLRLYPHIEKTHHKLWLTSTSVLESLLTVDVRRRTDLDIDMMREKVRLYVQNDSYTEARQILHNFHYCVIAGIPGIGKTTLAEVLILDYLAQGYEVYSVGENIADVFRVADPSRKQVFYFDDFLGQTALKEKLGRSGDHELLRLVEAVRRGKDLRLILTTREYILNQAKAVYEKLFRSDFDVRRCVIDLNSYTVMHRAQILYNHIYFAEIPVAVKEILIRGAYITIVRHKNFNPRLIEWMIKQAASFDGTPERYVDYFIDSLDSPARIWEHAFHHQLSDAGRNLLVVLASLPDEVFQSDLEEAFAAFHGERTQLTRSALTRDFSEALRELDGNFIRTFKTTSDIVVSFHNPSIADFLHLYLAENPQVVSDLMRGARFLDQCSWLWESTRRGSDSDLMNAYRAALLKSADVVVSAVLRNLNRPMAALTRGWGEEDQRYRDIQLMGDRLTLVLELVHTAAPDSWAEALDPFFHELLDDLHGTGLEDNIRGKELLDLMSILDRAEFRRVTYYDELLSFTKEALFGECQVLRDFERCVSFRYRWPKAVTKEEFEDLRHGFRWYLKYMLEVDVEDHLHSSYDIYDFCEELEDVARDLKVGCARAISRIEHLADEYYADPEVAEQENASLKRMREHDSNWGEIARMFLSLTS